jgi:hypothetical protein
MALMCRDAERHGHGLSGLSDPARQNAYATEGRQSGTVEAQSAGAETQPRQRRTGVRLELGLGGAGGLEAGGLMLEAGCWGLVVEAEAGRGSAWAVGILRALTCLFAFAVPPVRWRRQSAGAVFLTARVMGR